MKSTVNDLDIRGILVIQEKSSHLCVPKSTSAF